MALRHPKLYSLQAQSLKIWPETTTIHMERMRHSYKLLLENNVLQLEELSVRERIILKYIF
jgi:hypothetical protein